MAGHDRWSDVRRRTQDGWGSYGAGGWGRQYEDYARGEEEDRQVRAWRPQDDAAEPLGPGIHRGKGPKGYVRPDRRILEETAERLTEDPWLDASGIELAVIKGEVRLDGAVDSDEDRRRAAAIAAGVSGVTAVRNRLEVGADR